MKIIINLHLKHSLQSCFLTKLHIQLQHAKPLSKSLYQKFHVAAVVIACLNTWPALLAEAPAR